MIWPAILIGILGSVHCVGMCGPIAMALPVPPEKNRYAGIALYNTGRVITYGFLGLLFGSFGSLFVMAGLQQLLSIMAGSTLLLIILLSLRKKEGSSFFNWLNRMLIPLKNRMRFYLKEYSYFSLFALGILNGFLPCGLVYVAVVGAITIGNSLSGALYMMLFGIGTIPAMFLVSILGNSISFSWRYKITKTLPYVISTIGLILILRGLNLGIPYLSPEISSEKLTTSHCCSK